MPAAKRRLEFGDCANADTGFVSGPKPAAFDRNLIGWNTIGTSGYGGGVGGSFGAVGRHRSAFAPIVRLGQATVEGDLDKNIVRRYIRRSLTKISYCYEKQLADNAKLAGTVTTKFTITGIGAVHDVTAEGVDPKVSDCVKAVIAAIQFPKPKNEKAVKAMYPFTFSPPPAGSGSAEIAAPDYQPGAQSPLQGVREPIAACVARAAEPFGVGIVELAYDKSTNAVATVKVHGVDESTGACIAAAAKPATKTTQAEEIERCGFAYGDMPIDRAPLIEVAAKSISVAGKPIADDGSQPTIPALAEALPKHDDVVEMRTYFIRQASDVSPQLAIRVRRTFGDLENTFPIPHDAPAPKLPVVPVPRNTGSPW